MRIAHWISVWALCLAVPATAAAELRIDSRDGHLVVLLGAQPILTYVWADAAVPRPHFRDVFAPDGTRITRACPPDPVRDAGNDDHASFHPGVWLAFGDVGGVDVWRLKGRVEHLGFVSPPEVRQGVARFAVRNRYLSADVPPRAVCEEVCRYSVHPADGGYHLLSRSVFRALAPGVVFGDQEEMGFGIRLDTPLAVRQGGAMWNDAGGRGEAGTWGRTAAWCAAEGVVGGRRAGVVLVPGPGNFRPAWFHNRDYGLLVANPFGRKAMTAPDDDAVAADRTPLPEAGGLRLDFGVRVHSGPAAAPVDRAAHAQACAALLAAE